MHGHKRAVGVGKEPVAIGVDARERVWIAERYEQHRVSGRHDLWWNGEVCGAKAKGRGDFAELPQRAKRLEAVLSSIGADVEAILKCAKIAATNRKVKERGIG